MYSNLLKTTLVLLTLSLVSGCTSFFREPVAPVEVVTKTVEVKTPIVHPPMPRPIKLNEPKWYVVSEKNLDEFLEEMEKVNGTIVFFAMNVGDYEIMAYNMQEIKRYIKQLKEVVIYYQTIDKESDNGSETEKTQK
jgi:hypothetical protein